MDIKIVCSNPSCQQHVVVDASLQGRSVQCPACGATMQVAAAPQTASASGIREPAVSKRGKLTSGIILVCMAVVAGLTILAFGEYHETIWLGPPDPGAEQGYAHWYHGTGGAGFLSIDTTDPASGENDLTVGNIAAGATNHADWRSENFPLGPAANGRSPITFSFAYKLPANVVWKDNVQVYLRFFDRTRTNFVNQKMVLVGTSTGTSDMTGYKRATVTNIHAPKGAATADIWIAANTFGPWTSGLARFDDFSVTTVTERRWALPAAFAGLVLLLALAGVLALKWWRSG